LNFYFSGDYRKDVTRLDRLKIINFIKQNWNNNIINITTNRKSFINKIQNDENILASKINISPAGKVWDSYRHCEFANYSSPILLPKPNCKTVKDDFKDMENCILYDINYQSELCITNQKELKEKLFEVLLNEKLRNKIYESYFDLISNNHTRIKRSEYIISVLKKFKN